MKKSLQITFLAFVLALLLPIVKVNADGNDHDHTGWTEWNTANKLPDKPGNYYLNTDVKLTNKHTYCGSEANSQINICLNGHIVDLNGNTQYVDKQYPVVVTFYDESQTEHRFSVNEAGYWYLDENGEKIVKGGVITNTNTKSQGSPVFYFTSSIAGTKIILNGGNIVGNHYTTEALMNLGNNTIFEMNGGKIIGNAIPGGTNNSENSIIQAGYSGTNSSCFIMYGGSIEQNYVAKGTSNSKRYLLNANGGKLKICGGEIKNNVVEYGSIINMGTYYSGSSFYMTGGTISDNTVENSSSGAYVIRPSSKVTDCIISGGNIVNNKAMGIQVNKPSNESVKFIIGGTANISGNVYNGKSVDVYLSYPFLIGTDEFAPMPGMNIGIYSDYISGTYAQITTNGEQGDMRYMFSNNPQWYISYDDSNKYFKFIQPGSGKFAINVIPSANGTVIPNTYEGQKDATITLTVKPDMGDSYKDGTLKVMYNDGSENHDVQLTQDNSDTMKYSFTMPTYPVTVEAEFVAGPKIIVSKQGTNPTYGTALSDSAFFTVVAKCFTVEPTLKLEWKSGTGESVTWSETTPNGITASLSDTNISINTEASLKAGNYVFRVTNSENEFTDGTTKNPEFVSSSEVALTVDKIDSTATAPTAYNLTYDGTPQALVAEGTATGGVMQYALGEDAATEPSVEWNTSIPTCIDAKTYYVWYKVAGDENHNDTVAACVSATIAPKDITVTITPNGGTYNSAITGATAMLNGIATGDNVTPVLTYTSAGYNDTTVPVNAGTYTVTASLPDAAVNYNLIGTVTENFVIEKAVINVPVINSKTYTGSTLTADIDITGKNYEVTVNNGGIPVGKYDVVLTITDTAKANYKWEEPDASNELSKTLSFEVTFADNSWITVPSINNVVYGTSVSPAYESKFGNVTITYVGIDGTVYESNTIAPAKVGTYKATFSVSGTTDYGSLTENVEFTILKKQLIVSNTIIETSRVYDGTVVADVTSTGTLDNAESGDDVTVSAEAVFADANVGTAKAVTVIYDISGADADNYIAPESNTSLTASITAKEVTAPNIASKLYNGELLKADVSDTADYIVTKNDGGTAVGGYEVILTLVDPVNYKWSDSDIADKTLTFNITSEANIWITEPSIANVTYGTPVSPVYEAKFGNDTLVISYVGIYATTYESSTTAPIKAGTYKATFSVAGTTDYGSLTANVEFTISKKQLIVSGTTIIPSRVYDGTTIADIETVGILNNIIAGDAVALTATATYSDANAGTAKAITVTYAISGDDADNYFAPVNNTLLTADISAKNIIAPTIASKLYNGSLQKAEVPASTLYTVTANNGGTEVGSYDVVLTITDPVNYKWSDVETAVKTVKFEITTQPEHTIYGYSDTFGNAVTADLQNAKKDTKITLTISTANEYSLQNISVTNVSGASITLAPDNTFAMPDTDVTVNAVFTKNIYDIGSFSDVAGNAVTADLVSAAKGTKVTLTVSKAVKYIFKSLTVTDAEGNAVAVASDNTFIMPASAVMITAVFEKEEEPIIIIVPMKKQDNADTEKTEETARTEDNKGSEETAGIEGGNDTEETPAIERENAVVLDQLLQAATDGENDSEAITEAIVQAIATAVSEGNATDIVLRTDEQTVTEQGIENKAYADAATEEITEVTKPSETKLVVLAKEIMETIVEGITAEGNIDTLTVMTRVADVEFDAKTIESISEQSDGDVRLVVTLIKEEIAQNADEDNKVYFDVSLVKKDGTKITSFDGGSIKVTLPIPKAIQNEKVVVVYSDEKGHYSPVNGTVNKNGTFTFKTGHLSEYILMTQREAENLYNYIKDFGTLKAHVEDRSESTVTIAWDQYEDADGYIIYGNYCDSDGKAYKVKKIATITDSSVTEYMVKKLESSAYYKFRIKAYKVVDGKKYVTVKSNYVHAATLGGKQRVTSDIRIAQIGMKKTNAITLKADGTYTIDAKRYTDVGKTVHHVSIRYESLNPEVAKVSKKGEITAIGKGKCTILVIAENGLYEEIAVTVK